jgi:hypothetical protein
MGSNALFSRRVSAALLMLTACAREQSAPCEPRSPRSNPLVPMLTGVGCSNLFAVGDRYTLQTSAAKGGAKLALVGDGPAQVLGTRLLIEQRVSLLADGLFVQGYGDRDARGEELFVALDARGVERCFETASAMSARLPSEPQLYREFYGLFEGTAVLGAQGVDGSPEQLYAVAPCGAVTPLGSCEPREWLEWADGPVCQDSRTFRVLGGFSGSRLSPDDQVYSVTRRGLLRLLRVSPDRLKVRWEDAEPASNWEALLEFPAPLEEVADAGGNREGAALWLRAGDRLPAQLVIVPRGQKPRRSAIDQGVGARPQVAVGTSGWAATMPLRVSGRPSNCQFMLGTFTSP